MGGEEGSSGLVSTSSSLLFPSIPLTHFRLFYSQHVDVEALNLMFQWNEFRLQTLEIIDERYDWKELMSEQALREGYNFIDPLIFAVWRCRNLSCFRIGFTYEGHDLLGIAKLRHEGLKRFEIPSNLIRHRNMKKLIRVKLLLSWT
jgi:hypothetical protein